MLTVAAEAAQADLEPSGSTPGHGHHGNGSAATGTSVVSFKWDHVQEPYYVALWILVAGLCKLGTYGDDGSNGSAWRVRDRGGGGEQVGSVEPQTPEGEGEEEAAKL